VPTTVLAAHHLTTFGQRFAAYPITVRMLIRFVSAQEQQTRWPHRRGTVDLVIARTACAAGGRQVKDLA